MKRPIEHINKKEYLIKIIKSNPLEAIPIFFASLKTIQYRYIFRCIGRKTIVGKGAEIFNFSNVKIGSHCLVQDHTYIRAGFQGYIVIGNYCAINSFVKIFGHGGVEIGDHTQLGPGCLVTTTSHNYREDLEAEFKKVTIGRLVWIGAYSIILPGVTIGDNSVIGAGSIVTKDIPTNSIAVGNPARVIGTK
jgi:galactoside O-acetyltransferase